MRVSKKILQQAKEHAKNHYPNESCGLIISTEQGREYYPCDNLSMSANDNFILNPEDYAKAEDKGEILAIVHSHPDKSARPSMADRVSCELHGLPWLILSEPDVGEEWLNPTGYKAPLLGREFSHGILDCWTLCRDWYAREWGLELIDFERSNLWWEDKNSPSLYEENYEKAGFYKIPDMTKPQRGDMIIFQVGRTEHPNHAGIYLGNDGNLRSEETPAIFGNSLFIHHLYGKLSTRDIYGFAWQERTRMILRHKLAK